MTFNLASNSSLREASLLYGIAGTSMSAEIKLQDFKVHFELAKQLVLPVVIDLHESTIPWFVLYVDRCVQVLGRKGGLAWAW